MKLQEVEKQTVDFISSPYYQFSDSVARLENLSRAQLRRDTKFLNIVKQVEKIKAELYRYLNDTYVWED